MWRFAAGILTVFLSVGMLFAEADAPRYTPPTAPPQSDPMYVVLRLIGLTLVTLFVCGVLIWWARRAGTAKMVKANGGGRMVLDGQLALDGKAKVTVIRVDGKPVVVTTDATGLRSIVPLQERFDAVLDEEVTEVNQAGESSP